MASARTLLVLGLGNLLCGDDGLGVVAAREILRRYRVPEGARVLDGGTLGLSLLSCFEPTDDVILLDAVCLDRPPGSLVRLEGDEVAPAVRHRLSPHQVGVADLLDALRLTGRFPPRLRLLGLVPERIDLGLERCAAVDAAIPELVARTVSEAAALGFGFRPTTENETEDPGAPADLAAVLGL